MTTAQLTTVSASVLPGVTLLQMERICSLSPAMLAQGFVVLAAACERKLPLALVLFPKPPLAFLQLFAGAVALALPERPGFGHCFDITAESLKLLVCGGGTPPSATAACNAASDDDAIDDDEDEEDRGQGLRSHVALQRSVSLAQYNSPQRYRQAPISSRDNPVEIPPAA